jgi:RHS repeat-associated protein
MRLLFLSFALLLAANAHAQWTGANPAGNGSTQTYTYNDGNTYINWVWQITNGRVNSSSESGTTYTVNVTWGTTGTSGVLNFKEDNGDGTFTFIGSNTVTLSNCSVAVPVQAGVSRCGTGTVTLTPTVGSGGNTIRWYTSTTPGASPFATQASYTTPSLSATTTYYITSYNTTTLCESSPRLAVTVTINPVPGNATASNLALCGSGTANLTATVGSNGSTVRWYAASSGGSPLATATTYSPSVTTTTTYYIATYNSTTTCESARVPVTATVNPVPGLATAVGGSNCGPGDVTIVATPGANGDKILWYLNATGGVALSSANLTSYYAAGLTASTTYYAASTNTTTGCIASSRVAVVATINPVPVAPVALDNSRCGTGTVTLSGTVGTDGTTLRWYNTGILPVPTGTSFTTASLSATTAYTISSYNATTGCESSTVPINAIINPLPTVPTVTNGSLCGPGVVTLSAAALPANANTPQWYTAATGGTAFSTSTSYAPNLGATTSYYVSAKANATGCESSRVTVTGTINTIPAAPTVAGSYRFAAGNLAFTASGAPGYNWYSPGGALLQSGTVYATGVINTTTANVVYVKGVNNGCEGPLTWVTATIMPLPVIASNATQTVMGAAATLDAGAGYDSYSWKDYYTGQVLGTGQTFATSQPGRYVVTVMKFGAAGTSASFALNPALTGQNLNYVVTNTVRVKTTDPTAVPLLPVESNLQTIQYSDGLGRPLQAVVTQGSPGKKDLVQPQEYDANGRQPRTYLPYVSTAANGNYKSDALLNGSTYTGSAHNLFYTAANDKVANDAQPYAQAVLETSPLARVTEQGLAGAAWQPGSSHTVRYNWRTNTASEVRLWKDNLTTAAYYAAGTLLVGETTDENGNKVLVKKDLAGHLLEKHVQLDATNYLKTLYIYDDIGRLHYILQPEGVRQLGTGTTISTTLITNYAFVYLYDSRGRLVEKTSPGAAPIYYGYDPLDRLTLVQDGNLRPAGKWNYIKYDLLNRPVVQGIYTNTTQTTRATVQALLDALPYTTGTTYYETRQAGATYSNQSFPTTGTQPLSITYYDDYDLDATPGDDYAYLPQGLTGEGTPAKTTGRVTATQTLVVGTATWLTRYYFYDTYGQVIQVRANNHLSATVDNLTTQVYNFDGTLAQTKTYHKAVAGQEVTTLLKRTYDRGRLTQVLESINGAPDQLLAQYEYNELGQLVDKKLHATGTGFLQSVDYRYHIRGWLQSINNAQLANDTNATNDDTNDYFGMELFYEGTESSGLGNTATYNGNISALKWKNAGVATGSADQRSYKYTYDKSERLTSATFQAYTGSAWTKEANSLNEAMTYDYNGNIATLQRNQNQRSLAGANSTVTVDQLTYAYTAGNRLNKVTDAATSTGGFADGANVATEYTYNTAGSLTADQNKGISSITYNDLGKPQQIAYTNGTTIVYTYDAIGNKLKTATTTSGTTTTTDYVDSYVYTNNTLSFFSSPEGRVVKNGTNYEYQYAITDHQGNTRLVFTSAAQTTQTVSAGFETANQTTEQSNFSGYQATKINTITPTNPNATAGNSAYYLNGGYAGQVGITKSYKVFPGDVVAIQAKATYNAPSGTAASYTSFVSSLLTAFNLAAPAGGETGTPAAGVNAFGSWEIGASGDESKGDAMKVFVTIILFDKNYNFIDVSYKAVGASGALFSASYTVKEAGYAYLYISNEHPYLTDVYFDEVAMSYTPGAIIQSSEYYPFGALAQSSWTRDNTTANNFLANGGTELNTTTQLYDLDFRNYDPILGRLHQVDPMAEKFRSLTTYNYSFNSPVMYNDPQGDCPTCGGGARRISVLDEIYARMNGAWVDIPGAAQNGGMLYDYTNEGIAGYAERYSDAYLGERSAERWSNDWWYSKTNVRMDFTAGSRYYLDDVTVERTNLDGLLAGTKGSATFSKILMKFSDNLNQEGMQASPRAYEKFGVYDAIGFGADMAELYRQGNGAVRYGMLLGKAEKLLAESKIIKTMTASRQAFNTSVKVFKSAGRGIAVIGIGASIAEFATSDMSGGDIAKLVGSGVITATAFIPIAGPLISVGLGLLDNAGAFDGIYGYFDKK